MGKDTKKKTFEEAQVELLDLVEKSCVDHIVIFFITAGKIMTRQQARNILAKVGARLMFSKEVADPILTVPKG